MHVYWSDVSSFEIWCIMIRSVHAPLSSLTAVDVPVTRRSTIGYRAFPVAAACAWNSLPSFVTSASSLSTFKRHLKTYLFAVSY